MKKSINEQGWGGSWGSGGSNGDNSSNNNGWGSSWPTTGGGSGNGWGSGGGNTTGFPDWAKCLESSGAKKKNDNVVSKVNSGGDTLYFSKSGKFQYTFTSKPGEPNQMGNWRCNGTNGYLINMDNGDRWDGTKWIEGSQNNGGGGGNTSGGGRVSRRYHDCPTGPYTQGCRSEVVRKVQKCIGVKDDSLFGPITQGALESKGFKNGFTDADVSKLCSNDSEENKPTVVLPDWATCLKNLKKVSLSRDYDNVEIVMVPFANDKGYFWPTKEFLYLYKSGKEIRGSWSCDNSRLIIKTEDGQMWSETNGWETSVRRNNNNDDNNNNNNNNINYQDDYTTYDDNEDNYE